MKTKRSYLKGFKNIFVIILVVFAVWMLFFDANSWLIHHELNTEMDDLEDEKEYYKNEIEKDKKAIKELSTEEGIEKLAREKYYMKKDNEEIYIIEYEDSLKNKKQ
ncbi:cell division protein FtsB [Flavobacteriaceae bacterium MAR_2010_72]|nr:cell division protein FtsB [Flavobacteriaceae bacterium MAR_2010_72]TVZ60245.1 cell division protein FtsB [Flavobacteriaceae bacterium MAR_2010_105]